MVSGSAIATLVIFIIFIVFVIVPVDIPIPKTKPRAYFSLDLRTAPIIALAVLSAAQCLGPWDIRNGIVGTEGIKSYNILILLLSLAYMTITLDVTGILQAAAFWVSNKGGANSWKLYFYIFTLLSMVLGNDPVILSGAVFLVYYTKVVDVNPLPWLIAEFAAANTASMVFFVGNPTNVVICEGFNIAYSAYAIFPFIACIVVSELRHFDGRGLGVRDQTRPSHSHFLTTTMTDGFLGPPMPMAAVAPSPDAGLSMLGSALSHVYSASAFASHCLTHPTIAHLGVFSALIGLAQAAAVDSSPTPAEHHDRTCTILIPILFSCFLLASLIAVWWVRRHITTTTHHHSTAHRGTPPPPSVSFPSPAHIRPTSLPPQPILNLANSLTATPIRPRRREWTNPEILIAAISAVLSLIGLVIGGVSLLYARLQVSKA